VWHLGEVFRVLLGCESMLLLRCVPVSVCEVVLLGCINKTLCAQIHEIRYVFNDVVGVTLVFAAWEYTHCLEVKLTNPLAILLPLDLNLVPLG